MANKIWKIAGILLVFLTAFSLVLFLWRLLDLPTNDELFVAMKMYFGEYGYLIMLVSAFM